MSVKACVDCGVMIDEDIWYEELGMCVECSNTYFSDEEEQ
jgi:RNA polymerase subunit RPABC4/transcription elongation factor Spt4